MSKLLYLTKVDQEGAMDEMIEHCAQFIDEVNKSHKRAADIPRMGIYRRQL